MSISDYLAGVTAAASIEELWTMHIEKMSEYGFDRLFYGFTRYRSATSLGDPGDFVVLSNHDPQFVRDFLYSGLVSHAPMVLWALENEGACSWSRIAEMVPPEKMTDKTREVLELNRAAKVTAGYTISFKSISARSKGAISLIAPDGTPQAEVDEMWKEHGADLVVMNNVAHLKIISLPYNAPDRSLTKRQREALEWVGDGKTMQDIAVLMNLTTATVEKHLRLAREALSVETTAQAVMKAAFLNQMFIMEP